MKKLSNILFALFLIQLVMLCSCSDFERRVSLDDTATKDNQAESIVFAEQVEYDSLRKIIDSEKDLTQAQSLDYEDRGANHSRVTALLNKKNKVVKLALEEVANDGKMIRTSFYYSGAAVFFAKQEIYDYTKEKNAYGLIYSYFGNNNKVIYSAAKMANTEEELNSKVALRTQKTMFDPSKAKNIINQKGDFETRYQGHIDTEQYLFILVGTRGKNAQQSAIAYNKNFPLAEMLVKNEKEYLNRKLRVNFNTVTEINNFSYQGLTGIQLINEK